MAKIRDWEAWDDERERAEARKNGKWDIFLLVLTVPVLLLVTAASLLMFTVKWAFSFWANLTMDEVVYHLTSPLEGTGDDIMMKFYTYALTPAIFVMVLTAVCLFAFRRKRKKKYGRALGVVCLLYLGIGGYACYDAWTSLKIEEYLNNQKITSDFIENNYVDPRTVQMQFPEKKRNLIFIYLESVETTFADEENGGGFSFNCIPELTEMAKTNEDFSGNSSLLEGGHVEPGTTFTMGGMFAQTSGLPLQVGLRAQIMDKRGAMNEMYTQEHFFPGIVTLGDILKDEGYHNVLFIGSDAKFGGRKLYFTEHGDYEIDDFAYAVKRNWLEEKEISWGYPDWRLFMQAEERLCELAKEDKPFNLTMLTVDTHFEDGIRCKNCEYQFADNTYADVYACSSRQLSDFIVWCKAQDWYENTTIILSGDHTTMDSDFCDDVADDYQRKTYTCYINPASKVADPARRRSYTTIDQFPTTLAAMGVKIKGNRLGLGTNLFSKTDTLYETYGKQMDEELSRRSLFMEQASEFDPNTDEYKAAIVMYEKYQEEDESDTSAKDKKKGKEAKPSVTPAPGDAAKAGLTPTVTPTGKGDLTPTVTPTGKAGLTPSVTPTGKADLTPTVTPTGKAGLTPSVTPTGKVSVTPSAAPGKTPSVTPSPGATGIPDLTPSVGATGKPSVSPTGKAEVTPQPGSEAVPAQSADAAAAAGLSGESAPAEEPPAFLPYETEDVWLHIQGRDVIGSSLIRDIMLDPWKKVGDRPLDSKETESTES